MTKLGIIGAMQVEVEILLGHMQTAMPPCWKTRTAAGWSIPKGSKERTMTKLGIIGAMQVEVEILLGQMENRQDRTIAGSIFYEGRLEGLDVVVVQCGVGKVNAALCTQILRDVFGVTHLVNTGVAGSLCAQLDIGDLVVSQDAMYHDVDCVHFGYPYGRVPGMDVTAFPADDTLVGYAFAAAETVNPGHTKIGRMDCVHFGYPYGRVPGMDVTAFPADDTLVGYAFAAAETVNPGHTKIGRIATGDQFVADKALKDAIIAHTQGLCTEMEGAAIAQTAYRNNLPFVILRAISDKADDSAQMDYPTFEATAAKHCAQVTRMLAKRLAEAEM